MNLDEGLLCQSESQPAATSAKTKLAYIFAEKLEFSRCKKARGPPPRGNLISKISLSGPLCRVR